MVLDNLSNSLKDAMKKLAGKTVIDRAAVDEKKGMTEDEMVGWHP